jgi:hypothetical protein
MVTFLSPLEMKFPADPGQSSFYQKIPVWARLLEKNIDGGKNRERQGFDRFIILVLFSVFGCIREDNIYPLPTTKFPLAILGGGLSRGPDLTHPPNKHKGLGEG